ncbi:hypothetical protein Caci_4064 [Catenulispora acidiphila DSM 44928]|uniref:DUF317 domain-containing protein n=1 Tax=Catenulispora acidiphila (strain DSM 44928 / JCM 14897 / NBRC 102108 / NRRL B-24433 / ID139908) TaxID=479433 RepID=C7QG84_CATAD|nr:hypothetical protein [Catenulispora acidiphila]ACU72929.1 hypothetical protein Caci_4064 [Catenulispora acidiphila DSM 44928]
MHPEHPADPLGRALAEYGWTISSTDHPAQVFDPEARIWNSPDTQLMLSAHGERDGRHMITLYAPRAPQETEDPLWQVGGGPVPVATALAMARAALTAPAEQDHAAALTATGWTLAPEHVLSVSIAGLESWIGPAVDDEPTGFWAAFRFPMPTDELSTWTVKGAHGGTECSLIATAATPGEVIAAAAHHAAH